jgi:hypothetical protein
LFAIVRQVLQVTDQVLQQEDLYQPFEHTVLNAMVKYFISSQIIASDLDYEDQKK